jgi:hypothetical protein
MPSLTVRDIPRDVMQQLRRVAKEERRSVNAQVLLWLQQAGRQSLSLQERTRVVSRIRALRKAIFRRRGLGPDSAEMIRQMRDERARRIS